MYAYSEPSGDGQDLKLVAPSSLSLNNILIWTAKPDLFYWSPSLSSRIRTPIVPALQAISDLCKLNAVVADGTSEGDATASTTVAVTLDINNDEDDQLYFALKDLARCQVEPRCDYFGLRC